MFDLFNINIHKIGVPTTALPGARVGGGHCRVSTAPPYCMQPHCIAPPPPPVTDRCKNPHSSEYSRLTLKLINISIKKYSGQVYFDLGKLIFLDGRIEVHS